MKQHQLEVEQGKRYEFGLNWMRFLGVLNEDTIKIAETSLKEMLEVVDLKGKTFLDIGSGSGLFSLAARNLGAKVHSFDYDPSSVWCTKELKRRFYEDDKSWKIEEGSVLDIDYIKSLGSFDVVYSWGVLHHTGDMWTAIENARQCVTGGGKLFIALYNYQQFFSTYWTLVKRAYNKHTWSRPFFILIHFLYPTLPSILLQAIQGRRPPRGMTYWYDLLDWLGGYPFEVSTPKQVFDYFRQREFELTQIKTVGGRHGCNEYVFLKKT